MKKRCWALLIFFLGVIVVGVSGCGSESYLKDVKVTFAGYQGNGSADIPEKIQLAIMKRVAEKEGKSAKVDSDLMKAYIDKAEMASDLASETNFEQGNLTNEQALRAQEYLDHMYRTRLDIKPRTNLTNGQKIQVILKDNSEKPYFKPASKGFKVSGLKTPKKISMNSVMKTLSYKPVGISGRGNIEITVKVADEKRINVTRAASAAVPIREFKLSNGDEVSIAEVDVFNLIKPKYPQYKFVRSNSPEKHLTVKGLESNEWKVSNLDAVASKVQGMNFPHITAAHPTGITDKFSGKLTHALYSGGQSWLTMIFETTAHKYFTVGVYAIVDTNSEPKRLIADYQNQPLEDKVSQDPSILRVSAELDADPFTSIQKQSMSRQYILNQA